MLTLSDLMKEEISRLDSEISATTAALKVHYNSPSARGYDIKDATSSLATFMQRSKETTESDLQKKYIAIKAAPKAALWQNLPPNVNLPVDAIKPRQANTARPRAPVNIQPQANAGQGFRMRGRNTWRSPRGSNRARRGGRGTFRGTNRPNQGPRHPQRDQRRETLQQAITMIANLF